MAENQILELFLSTLLGTQSEMCVALGLDKKKMQPRFSLAFKGEKYSFSQIIRICEEKRVLSVVFVQEVSQRFQKKDEEIILLQNKLIEKHQELDRVANLFQAYLSKSQEYDQSQPAGASGN